MVCKGPNDVTEPQLADSESILRDFGAREQTSAVLDEKGIPVFWHVAGGVVGDLEVSKVLLERAVEILAFRHPHLLGSVITQDSEFLPTAIVYPHSGSSEAKKALERLHLEISATDGPDLFKEFLDNEAYLNVREGPLFSVGFTTKSKELVVGLYHAIEDQIAVNELIIELVTLIGDSQKLPLEVVPMPGPAHDLVAAKPGLWRVVKFVFGLLRSGMGKAAILRPGAPETLDDEELASADIHTFTMDVTSLRDACRAHQATVQSALMVAAAHTAGRLLGVPFEEELVPAAEPASMRVAVMYPSNMRPQLASGSISAEMGSGQFCCQGFGVEVINPSTVTDAWAQAQESLASMHRNDFVASMFVPGSAKSVRRQALVRKHKKLGRALTLLVTNVGVVDVGPAPVEQIRWSAPLHTGGPTWMLSVATIGERMTVCVSGCDAVTGKGSTQIFTQELAKTLNGKLFDGS